jgi:3-deoxy-D-manno-octulosonate 8-phosphate phosphatase (KDO 8-P phosphatase)
MPYSHLNDLPADIRERASRVRLACFDVDGTLTDGSIVISADGELAKTFNVHDGLGIKLLARIGIEVALVTARSSRIVEARARELGLTRVHQGVDDKRACLRMLCGETGIEPEQASFMGDDLGDLPALSLAGLSAAPANAHPWVRERVHWRTRHGGGQGAVRELCDVLLAASGQAETILSRYLEE